MSEVAASAGGSAVSRSITYRWLFGREFVRAESERRSDHALVRMEITYFRDYSAQKIRAAIFSSDGSSGQADVDFADGAVVLHALSVGPDGTPQSMVSTLRPVGDGTRTEAWSNIRVGERSMPDPPPILWRRK